MAKITACSTLVYTTGSLREAIKRISARGFSRVEIAYMGDDGEVTLELEYQGRPLEKIERFVSSEQLHW